MTGKTFRLILLVSCAHALVHVYELSLPSVEQMIGDDYSVGKDVTGMLGTAWRMPFGLAALAAGWCADRYGSKRMLLVFLWGCAGTCLLVSVTTTLPAVFLVMFAMGSFASIYHPAGLALISRETTPENHGAALGWHGIFGSLGIASAPFLAAVVFTSGNVSWKLYYLLLAIPGAVLAVCIALWLVEKHKPTREQPQDVADKADASSAEVENGDEPAPRGMGGYFVLVTSGAMQGFIYGAFMHFLPRYLGEAGLTPENVSEESYRNYLAAVVLICGVVGQAVAGKLARPGRLEFQLAGILFANAPLLAWMAVAEGPARFWATCLLALVHFMSQPVYNSLIAQHVSTRRRSTGYGFSNMIVFGIGALAPTFAGLTPANNWVAWTYGGLAVIAIIGGLLALLLRRNNWSHKERDSAGGGA